MTLSYLCHPHRLGYHVHLFICQTSSLCWIFECHYILSQIPALALVVSFLGNSSHIPNINLHPTTPHNPPSIHYSPPTTQWDGLVPGGWPTLPQNCVNPKSLPLWVFSALLVVCDQDKKPHVVQQILKGGNFCQLTSLLLQHKLFDCIKSRFWLNVTKTRNSCLLKKILRGNIF